MDTKCCGRVGLEPDCWPSAEGLADEKLVGIVVVCFPAAWVIRSVEGTLLSAVEVDI